MKKISIFILVLLLLIGLVSAATIPMRYTLDFYNVNGITRANTISAGYFVGDGSGLTNVSTGNLIGSGLLNYIPKFSATTNLTISGISDDGTTVTFGNGTTKLNISNISDQVLITSGYSSINFSTNIIVNNNLTVDGNSLTVDSTNNIVTIPTTVAFYYPNGNERNWLLNGSLLSPQVGAAPLVAGLAVAVSHMDFIPFLTGSKDITFDNIGFPVNVANSSTACNIGIYNDSGSISPSTLRANASNQALAATGYYNWTITPVTMKANSLYWFAYQCNATTTAALYQIESRFTHGILGYQGGATIKYNSIMKATRTYNATALPSTAPATAPDQISTPFIGIRVRTDLSGTYI